MSKILSVHDSPALKLQRTKMGRDLVLEQLRERGCRITRQRQALLDIILEGQCSSCKEIYVEARKRGCHVGSATVYRLVNVLEEMGAIRWKDLNHLAEQLGAHGEYVLEYSESGAYSIRMADGGSYRLDSAGMGQVLKAGLAACGYRDGEETGI